MKKLLFTSLLALSSSLFTLSYAQCPDCHLGKNMTARAERHNHRISSTGDTLNMSYQAQNVCGLNYTQVTVLTETRTTSIGCAAGTGFPTTLGLTGMPLSACATVQKAYIYFGVSYTEATPPPATITITNPSAVVTTLPATMQGSGNVVCWGEVGTATYRVDVTSQITGNGNYGVDVSGFSDAAWEIDGLTLIVIYTDPTASYSGSIQLNDGDICNIAGEDSVVMRGFSVCAATGNATAFGMLGDMQCDVSGGVNTETFNGSTVTFPNLFWNFCAVPTSLTAAQDTLFYDTYTNDASDCYFIGVAGLYWQNTTCTTCVPVVTTMTLTASSTAATCGNNGTASVSVVGNAGPPVYNWSPGGQTNATATGLAPGTYTVSVSDGNTCASDTITVGYTGISLSLSLVNQTCSTLGSAQVNVSGGTSPYTYLWSPGGQTNASITGLTSGSYIVSVTDHSGCTLYDTATIIYISPIFDSVTTTPTYCASLLGTATANPTGGTTPYTYLWSPGGQTTQSATGLSSGTYTIVVTDSAGCGVSTTVYVPSTYPTFSISASPDSVLSGDTTILIAYCSSSSATYLWEPSGATTSSIAATPLVTTTYTVLVNSPCGSDSMTITVYVNLCANTYNQPICIVTIDTALDRDEVIWERSNSPATGEFYLYKENSSFTYSFLVSQAVTVLSEYIDTASRPEQGPCSYELSTVDSCGQSALSPPATSIFLWDSTGVNQNTLYWTAYVGFTPTYYYIYRGSNLSTLVKIDSVSSTTLTYTDLLPPPNCVYMIEVVNPAGPCIPSLHVLKGIDGSAISMSNIRRVMNVTAVPTITDAFSNLTIYPNPSNGMFTIQWSVVSGQSSDVKIDIVNELGQIVYTEQKQATTGINKEQLNLENLASGIYSLRMQTNNNITVKKLVVIKK